MRKVLALSVAALLIAAVPAAASRVTSTAAGSKAAPAEAARRVPVPTAAEKAAATGRAVIDPFLSDQLRSAAEAVAIVHGSSFDSAVAALNELGLPLGQRFEAVDAVATVLPASKVDALAEQPGVVFLEGNRPLQQFMDTAVHATRVEVAETEYHYTRPPDSHLNGEGVGVAIVDSGLAADHPMFAGRVVRNFRYGCTDIICPAPQEPLIDAGPTGDTDSPVGGGHGTHVAGIAAGARVKTSQGVPVRGVATASSIYGFGSGALLLILNAASSLDWILQHHADPCFDMSPRPQKCPPIRVVNNSYGGVGEYDPDSLNAKLSDALVKAGVVVVWAAGNGDTTGNGGDGSDNRTNGPGASPVPGVIMVANYNDGNTGSRNGTLDASSSRGEKGRPETYPDVSAPGAWITSACKPTLAICHSGLDTSSGDLNYGTISGTSMASPHVAGAVAELLQAHPGLTPGEVELAIERSAYKFGDAASYEPDVTSTGEVRNPHDTTSFDKGHGLLDLANALRFLDKRKLDERKAAPCPSGGYVLSDPAGDATKVAVVDGGEVLYSAARDVTAVAVHQEGDKVRFTVDVASLGDPLADAPGGVFFESAFSAGGAAHEIVAVRDALGAASFTVDGTEVPGEFRLGTPGLITLTAPRKAFEPDIYGTVTFTGFSFYTRYDTGAVLAPVADDGSGAGCVTFDVGGTAPPVNPDFKPPKSEATIRKGQSHDFQSTAPKTDIQVLGSIDETLIGPCDVTIQGCDERGFQLEPGKGSELVVSITGEGGALDLDLYVLDPHGQEVARSATEAATETVKATIKEAGVYTVRVVWYVSIEGTYKGTISLK